jgi:capsular exopolysaccharide synthesis family protein
MNGSTAICISSAGPREGKSTVAANLAILEAKAGKRVVLIDANLCHPYLHQFFGLHNTSGLSTFLAQAGASVQPPLQNGPYNNIKILPAGSLPLQDDSPTIQIPPAGCLPSTAAELLGSPRMVDLVALLRRQADVVIIDSAPICPTPDTLLLQRAVDGTVLVMDARRTGMKALGDAVSALQHASGTLLGVVLNKAAPQTRSSGRRDLRPHQAQAGFNGHGKDVIIQPAVAPVRAEGQ